MAILGIGTDLLSSYLSARVNLRLGGVNGVLPTKADSSSSQRSQPLPPWDPRNNPPENEALVRNAFSGKDFIDENAARGSNYALDNDYKKMFALHTALRTLSALSEFAGAKGTSSLEKDRAVKKFDEGWSEVNNYFRDLDLDNTTLLKGKVADKVESTTDMPRDYPYYKTGALHTGSYTEEVSQFADRVQFKMTTTKADGSSITFNVDFDDMGGTTRTMDNVASFLNQKLENAGMVSRFSRYEIVDDGASADEENTAITAEKKWGFKISGSLLESISFAAAEGLEDEDDNIFISGTERNILDSDSEPISRTTGFVEANGTLGDTAWSDFLETDGGETLIRASATHTDGSYFVLAETNAEIDGQPIKGDRDVALTKYDSAGQVVFTRVLGAAVDGKGYALAVGTDGSVAVAGAVEGRLTTLDIGYGVDSFVTKFDSSGEEEWTRRRGGVLDDEATAVAIGADGSVYVGGRTKSSLSGDDMQGGYDNYIRKYDEDGVLIFTDQYGTSSDDKITSIAVAQATAAGTGGTSGPDSRDAYIDTYHDDIFSKAEAAATVEGVMQSTFGSLAGDMLDYTFDDSGAMYALIEDTTGGGGGLKTFRVLKVDDPSNTNPSGNYHYTQGAGGQSAYLDGTTPQIDVNGDTLGISYRHNLTYVNNTAHDLNFESTGGTSLSFFSSQNGNRFDTTGFSPTALKVDDEGSLIIAGVNYDTSSGIDTNNVENLTVAKWDVGDNDFAQDTIYTASGSNLDEIINDIAIDPNTATGDEQTIYLVGGRDGGGLARKVDFTFDNAGNTLTIDSNDAYDFQSGSELTNATVNNGTLYTYGTASNGSLDPDYDAGDDGTGAVSMDTRIINEYSGSGTDNIAAWIDIAEDDEATIAYYNPTTGDPGAEPSGGGSGGEGSGGSEGTGDETIYVAGLEGSNSTVRIFSVAEGETTPTAGKVYDLGNLGTGGIKSIKAASDAFYVAGGTSQTSLQFTVDSGSGAGNITTRLSNEQNGVQDGFVARVDTGDDTAAVAFVGSVSDDILDSLVLTGVEAIEGTGGGTPGTDPTNNEDAVASTSTVLPGALGPDDARNTYMQTYHDAIKSEIDDMAGYETDIQNANAWAGNVLDYDYDENGNIFGLIEDTSGGGTGYDTFRVFKVTTNSGPTTIDITSTTYDYKEGTTPRIAFEDGKAVMGYIRDTDSYHIYTEIDESASSASGGVLTLSTPSSVASSNVGDTHDIMDIELDDNGNAYIASQKIDTSTGNVVNIQLGRWGYDSGAGYSRDDVYSSDQTSIDENINDIAVHTSGGSNVSLMLVGDRDGGALVREVNATNGGFGTFTVDDTSTYEYQSGSSIQRADYNNGTLYTYGASTETALSPTFDEDDDGSGVVSLSSGVTNLHTGSGSNTFVTWLDTAEQDEGATAYFDPSTGTIGTSNLADSRGNYFSTMRSNLLTEADNAANIEAALQAVESLGSLQSYDFDGSGNLYGFITDGTDGTGYVVKTDSDGNLLQQSSAISYATGTSPLVTFENNTLAVGFYDDVADQTEVRLYDTSLTQTNSITGLTNRTVEALSVDGDGNVHAVLAKRDGSPTAGIINVSVGKWETSTGQFAQQALYTDTPGLDVDPADIIIDPNTSTGANQTIYIVSNSGSDGIVHELDVTYTSGTNTYTINQEDAYNVDGATLTGGEFNSGTFYLQGSTTDTGLSPEFDEDNDGSGATSLTTQIQNPHSGSGSNEFLMWLDTGEQDEAGVSYYTVTEGTPNTWTPGEEGTEGTGGGTTDASAIYVGGSTYGELDGQLKRGSRDGILAKLTFDGTDLNIDYTKQFGRSGTRLQDVVIGVADGSSDLAKLGLPTGTIDYSSSQLITQNSSLRSGDYFYLSRNERSPVKIRIEADDTLRTLANKINQRLGIDGRAEVRYKDDGQVLKITARKGQSVLLQEGEEGRDVLKALGLAPGMVRITERDSKGREIEPVTGPIYGLRLPSELKIDTEENRKYADERLNYAISTLKRAYRESVMTKEERMAFKYGDDKPGKQGNGPTQYMQDRIAHYQNALVRIQAITGNQSTGFFGQNNSGFGSGGGGLFG